MAKVKIKANASIKKPARQRFGVYLTETAAQRLAELSKQTGISRSAVIEQLIMSAQIEK